ncbi:MAG: DegQ family serine endoprotease [Phycisphaerales bacterium]|nr:DegQ family serine endoprotease [Phycisphaerales bacterium]
MKKTRVILVFALLTGTAVALGVDLPNTISRVAYDVERGQATAAREQLKEAHDLSAAFQYTAEAVKPSVVNIRSVKHVAGMGHMQRSPNGAPEGLQEFFGDDLLRQFLQRGAPQGDFVQQGMGTGVIVGKNGYVLTNNHVVDGADELTVTLSDDRTFTATVVGTDAKSDLAVVKIEADNLMPAELGDSDDIRVGEWVLALGNPFGLTQTVTAGIISAKGRANVGIADYEDFIQTDAAINPGNSGGPLVSLDGKVIGINTAIATHNGGYQGVGFAIPTNMAKVIMNEIINDGKVVRGWMGAAIQNLTADLAKSFNYSATDGVLIGDVSANGPAANAGLQSGDIIVKYDGKSMHDMNQLRNNVAATKPGTDVTLNVVRDGRELTKTIEIGELEAQSVIASGHETSEDLGFAVQTLTPDLSEHLGLDADEHGVIVTGVEPGSLAERSGIRVKDLIISVGGNQITDLKDFHNAMKQQDLSEGVRIQVKTDGLKRFIFLRKN